MKPSVSIQVRVPTAQAIVLRRAARQRGMKLAAYVRWAAVTAAQQAHVAAALVNARTA